MAGRSVGDPKEPVPRYAWSLDVTTETWSDRELRHGQAEREYAQARGFVTDPARVCSPQDHAWSGWCDRCAATSLPARSSSIWPTRRTAPRFGAGIRPVSACTAPSTPPGRGVRPVRSVAAVAGARGALSGAESMRRVVSTQGDQAGHCQLEQSEGDFRRVRLRDSPGRV